MKRNSQSLSKYYLQYDRNSVDIASCIKQTFEEAINTELYSRSQISIRVIILQDDGGSMCACMNGVTLALIDAGISMKDMVTSCSAGFIEGKIVLVEI